VARTGIELRTFFRERNAVVFIFAYPLIMMVIFATVFTDQVQGAAGVAVPFAQYFLPGILATGVMLSSLQSLAVTISLERDDGTLNRLRATPLPTVSYFLGKIGLVLVTTVVQAALLIALAALAYDVPLPGAAGWGTFAWVLTLGAASGAVCGVAASSLVGSGRSASAVITPILLVLQFISGVFFPFFSLPSWMQTLASVFPLRWMAQGMRAVFLPDGAKSLEPAGTWQLAMVAAMLAAWLVVGLLVGLRTFRWRRRDDG
jgi:ABC-2 type transport system permease protein